MSYAKALAKLESLPADEQELASGRYVFELRDGKPHCGCAIGKLLTEEQRAELTKYDANTSSVEYLNEWRGSDYEAPIYDMTFRQAEQLQHVNDFACARDNSDASRKERYGIVIEWLRKQVAP